MESVSVYIDGFNLYYGMREKYGRRFHWLDPYKLGQSFLTGGQQLGRVVYFTARVRNNPSSQANQGAYLSALKAVGLCEVVEGRFQSKDRTCIRCGHRHTAYEEKETDVSLAAALVEDAAMKRYDKAILVTADSDLGPAVMAAKRLNAQARIVAAFPPSRRSGDLARQVQGTFAIGRDKLSAAQLPTQVVDATMGKAFARPAYWA